MFKNTNEFDYIKIKLASPSRILKWANRILPDGQNVGEVQKSDTLNYRTFKPEMGGLFCERIFGPTHNFECACGKYKRFDYQGLVCERCGVELVESRVRRYRLGHINLLYPVTHSWYLNSRPNFIALLLEVEEFEKNLNTTYTIYSETCNKCAGLKVTPSTITKLWDNRIKRIKIASIVYFITEDEVSFYSLHWDLQQYRSSRQLGYSGYPLKPYVRPENRRYNIPKYITQGVPDFVIGTPVIKEELDNLDLQSEISRMRCFILICTKVLNKEKPLYNESKWVRKWERQRLYKIREQSIKRVRILENLMGAGTNPAWMILTVLPVIPPALRPMLILEGGRLITSDLNEIYVTIINRNNRLLRLLLINAPQVAIRNEKRLLQEAVDTLIDNGKRGKAALDANNRPLKSLSDIIKGKHGRFRQNLLGKRVDYSGRSVIVVGPNLKLNQCGLPYGMAIELFSPFVIRELLRQKIAETSIRAMRLVDEEKSVVEPILREILRHHPVFLNRAPTLHRLGIQAFESILVEGKAIQLHPLVCSAFNADFDGDQMAVHVPLSLEAQTECYMLMLSPYNFLSPANGEPIITPSQDMVLGCYYLTVSNIPNSLGSNHYFADLNDVILAYTQNKLDIHSTIWVRVKQQNDQSNSLVQKIKDSDCTQIEIYKNQQIRKTQNNKPIVIYLKTTTGKVILNSIIQKILNQ